MCSLPVVNSTTWRECFVARCCYLEMNMEGGMKAFPRRNKYTLCLRGLVLAIQLGWCLSLGDPHGAPPRNTSSCAALVPYLTGCSTEQCQAAFVLGPAGVCRRAPACTPCFERVPRKQQEPCGCSKPRSRLLMMSV